MNVIHIIVSQARMEGFDELPRPRRELFSGGRRLMVSVVRRHPKQRKSAQWWTASYREIHYNYE